MGLAGTPPATRRERRIGVILTESCAMRFGSSVPGLYIAHRGVHNFRAAKVERDQAEDYGRRHGMSIVEVERRLASVLNDGPASVDEAEARRCDRLRLGAMRPGNLPRGRGARRNFTADWRGPHEFRSGLSGVRQAMGAPARPAGAQHLARSICCSSRPLPRSRPFARWDANSPRW